MLKILTAIRPEALPLNSELGRHYAAWQEAEKAADAAEAPADRLAKEYGEVALKLERATLATMTAEEFAFGSAQAELLRRELPAAQAKAAAARQQAKRWKIIFAAGYRQYQRDIETRNWAAEPGRMVEFGTLQRLDRAIAAAVGYAA